MMNYSQGFETDTSGWYQCPNVGSDVADGPINRVASGVNGIPAYDGNYYGVEPGGPDYGDLGGEGLNDFTYFGLTPSTAPGYTGWAATATAFPAGGFKASLAIYLDVGNSIYQAANDTRFDWDIGMYDSSANFLRDFVFNAGFYNNLGASGNQNGFVIAAGNNAGRGSSYPEDPGHNPITITTGGWYTFNDVFTLSPTSGALQDLMTVDNAQGDVVGTWTLSNPGDTNPGGIVYGAFEQQEFSNAGLAIDDATVTVIPEPGTVTLVGIGLVGMLLSVRRRKA
jgi:hypothetical protein